MVPQALLYVVVPCGNAGGSTRRCSNPRPPPLPLLERESSRVPELSRDVHDACVESSLARVESIEPLRWGMAQIHIGSQNVLWIVQTLDTSGKDNYRGLDGCGC